MSRAHLVHMREPYYRSRAQGGDTQHPLCCVPLTGWAGSGPARWAMTDVDEEVECGLCLRALHAGGVTARKARLLATLDVSWGGPSI